MNVIGVFATMLVNLFDAQLPNDLQFCKESRSEIVNKQVNGNIRIRGLQLRDFGFAFSSYQLREDFL